MLSVTPLPTDGEDRLEPVDREQRAPPASGGERRVRRPARRGCRASARAPSPRSGESPRTSKQPSASSSAASSASARAGGSARIRLSSERSVCTSPTLTRARGHIVLPADDPDVIPEDEAGSSRRPHRIVSPGRRHGARGSGELRTMKTWTATTSVDAAPEAVLDVLTDPDAIARWAPLPFDVDDLDTPRLMAGLDRPRVRPPGRPPRRLRRRGPRGRVPRGCRSLRTAPSASTSTTTLAATESGSRGSRLRLRPRRQGHHRPPPRRGDQRPAVRRRADPRHLAPRGRGGVPRLTRTLPRKALPC